MTTKKRWSQGTALGTFTVCVCLIVYIFHTGERFLNEGSSGYHRNRNTTTSTNAKIEENKNNITAYNKTVHRSPKPRHDCNNIAAASQKITQEDPWLVDCVRQMIQPPSAHPYQLRYPEKIHFSQVNQSKIADDFYFHGMRDGFFIEVGALDGEHLSNTLYFERELGWRGLLIEPLPHKYQELRQKHRKAFTINAALATDTSPSEVFFTVDGIDGGLSRIMRKPNTKIEALKSRLSMLSNSKKDEKPVITVQTLPLYSILKALNVTVVDFLSLDIEGYEVKILKTLPWDKVKFRLMCIEINHVPEGVHHLVKYLKGKGYQFLGKNIQDAWFGWPELLRKKSCAAC